MLIRQSDLWSSLVLFEPEFLALFFQAAHLWGITWSEILVWIVNNKFTLIIALQIKVNPVIYPEHFNCNTESIKMTLPSFGLHMAFLFSFYPSSGNSYCSTAAEGQNELIELNKADGLQLSNQSNVELLCILLQVCFPHLLSFPLILLFCQS